MLTGGLGNKNIRLWFASVFSCVTSTRTVQLYSARRVEAGPRALHAWRTAQYNFIAWRRSGATIPK